MFRRPGGPGPAPRHGHSVPQHQGLRPPHHDAEFHSGPGSLPRTGQEGLLRDTLCLFLTLYLSLSLSVTVVEREYISNQSINESLSTCVFVCVHLEHWSKKLTRIHYCVMLHHFLLLLLDNYDDDKLRNGSDGRVMGIGIRKWMVGESWVKRWRRYIRVDDTILDRFRDFETKL